VALADHGHLIRDIAELGNPSRIDKRS